ncbi:MAG: hypothetical protein WCK29_01855 [archaeon]
MALRTDLTEFSMPGETIPSNCRTPEKSIPFYDIINQIKDAMFRRDYSTISLRKIDLVAALEYSLSPRGMGLV